MPTKTPQSPQDPSDRHLSAVPNADPKTHDRRKKGLAAVALAAVVAGAGIVGVTRGPEPKADRATEQNEAAERNLLAPLFDPEAVMPYATELGEVSQLKGTATITITEQNGKAPFGINIRKTPVQQRADSEDMFTEDNVMVSVGNPAEDDETVRGSKSVVLVDPMVITAEDGTQWYGGIVTEQDEDVPLAAATASPDAFANSVGWVDVTKLMDQYSGADVAFQSGDSPKTVVSFADPNIDSGPYFPTQRVPVAYVQP
jgi:hypothetical protein